MRSELVSRAWKEQASSRHVWRTVFRRAYGYGRSHSTALKTKPSAGLGKSQPNQNWKRMFLVRCALERRWKEGKAAAIYLHGHKDSVYCAQFDRYVDTLPKLLRRLLTVPGTKSSPVPGTARSGCGMHNILGNVGRSSDHPPVMCRTSAQSILRRSALPASPRSLLSVRRLLRRPESRCRWSRLTITVPPFSAFNSTRKSW